MRKLFNAQAADAAIAGVLAPDDASLASCISHWTRRRPIRICSGGTTSSSARAGQWCVDLQPHFQTLDLSSDHTNVTIGAGCTMADVLEALARGKRTMPAGLSGAPGLGYVLTGGMGPLSRQHGLAIDQLLRIRGVWGNGSRFAIERPTLESEPEQRRAWRGLCGAAAFLGVVTDVTIRTLPLHPLAVTSQRIHPEQLPQWMAWAEQQGANTSLQWHWGDQDDIQLLIVDAANGGRPGASHIDGLHQLPALATPAHSDVRTHSEVVGLLGPANAEQWQQLIQPLRMLVQHRPHPGCNLACQQLGGATSTVGREVTSFVHRQAIWKPWITAAWPAQDSESRQRSLDWLQEVWALLEPICPGVHLAQLHDHLPWHRRELSLAFGDWLPGLRDLKRTVDPNGNLPTL